MPPKRKSRTLVRSIAVKAQDFHLEYLTTLPRGAARNHEGKVEALSYLIRQFATEEEARESRSLSNDEAAKLVVQLVMAARQSSLRAVKFAQLSVLKLPFSKDNLYEKRSSPLYGVPESVLNDAGRTLLIPHFNGTHIVYIFYCFSNSHTNSYCRRRLGESKKPSLLSLPIVM